ncbi:MAG: DUF2811 domain-containing protein [Cyanobacteria bacterium P01_F01_bin.53]
MFHNEQTTKRSASSALPLLEPHFICKGHCGGRREILSSEKFVEGAFAMQQSVSLSVEIPEELHASVQHYLDTHSGWGQDRLFCAAISLFLMQNGVTKHQVSRIYLDSLFGSPSESNKEIIQSKI